MFSAPAQPILPLPFKNQQSTINNRQSIPAAFPPSGVVTARPAVTPYRRFALFSKILLHLRHDKVILDSDLAALYGVSTKALNQAVKRNIGRFPEDFMFQLTAEEIDALISNHETFSPNRSQIVTGSQKHRDPRYLPYAFTEQGVAMLSSVLRSAQSSRPQRKS